MIDDLKQIYQRDKDDILGIVAHEWEQLTSQTTWSRAPHLGAVANVVYSCPQGPIEAALMVQAARLCKVPFEVNRDPDIPSYIGRDTLFIICTFSDNIEEVAEISESAAAKGAQIAIIAGSGRLTEIADQKEYLLAHVKDVRNNRFATFFILKALIMLLEMAGVSLLAQGDLVAASAFLKHEAESWLPEVPTKLNFAKQIAQECMGRSVVLYSYPKLVPAAYRWKRVLNESSKQLAWYEVLSEFDFNEAVSWGGQPEQKPYAVVELRSSLDSPRAQQQFKIAERLLSGVRPHPNVINVRGSTILEQLLWSIILADFVSSYLALLNGYDPASLVIVDKIKRAVDEYNSPDGLRK